LRILNETRPDEIYNLAGQSHPRTGFDSPEHTADVTALGALRLLETVRLLGLDDARIYQAGSSEMFGDAPPPQSEATPFRPCSPSGAAKLHAYWLVRSYRDGYGMHASNGILFNHESPLRSRDFATRRITRAAARVAAGDREALVLGDLDVERDWGHARDYVEGMWRMLQQPEPDDYVLATGRSATIRDFCNAAFRAAGILLAWEGEGLEEVGRDMTTGDVLVRVDRVYFRPVDARRLRGDPTKAMSKLGWMPRTGYEEVAAEMTAHDLADLKAFADDAEDAGGRPRRARLGRIA
ncbi:MAG: GDP-mannose 4,6-dehydratase, partial [Alphaproteobacteria bacterium]